MNKAKIYLLFICLIQHFILILVEEEAKNKKIKVEVLQLA